MYIILNVKRAEQDTVFIQRYKMKVTTSPDNFKPLFESAGCLLIYKNEILLLKRSSIEDEAGLWGFPGGKRDANETPEEGLVREVKEETSIKIYKEKLTLIEKLDVRTDKDFIYRYYTYFLDEKPNVVLTEEHDKYKWVTQKNFREYKMHSSDYSKVELALRNVP